MIRGAYSVGHEKSEPWLLEVANAVIRVLQRRRYGLIVKHVVCRTKIIEAQVVHKDGDPDSIGVYLKFVSWPDSVHLTAADPEGGEFHFTTGFSRYRPPKIKRCAHNLAMKIMHKPVYDIMHI